MNPQQSLSTAIDISEIYAETLLLVHGDGTRVRPRRRGGRARPWSILSRHTTDRAPQSFRITLRTHSLYTVDATRPVQLRSGYHYIWEAGLTDQKKDQLSLKVSYCLRAINPKRKTCASWITTQQWSSTAEAVYTHSCHAALAFSEVSECRTFM